MACCGTSATTEALASTRSRQGPPPKLISSKSSKSLYGSQPFGDARSCEIFVEHAVAGFWHCASCGVPKCSHFNAKRCAAVPPPKDHAGPVYQRKGSKRGGSWRDREATLVAGKLKLFEVAEGGGPGPHVATCVEIDHWTARPSRRQRGSSAERDRGDGGAAGAAKRAGERLAARLETSTDRDLVKAFGKGVAGKACRSLMKLNEAAHRRRVALAAERPPAAASALRAPVGEGLKIAGVDARDRAAACTRVLCSLAREPTLQQALSAYRATRSGRGGAALTGADEIVAPTLLLADAALLSYGPANLDSLAPTNENAAAYATTVLLNLASAAAASTEGHEAVTAALRDLGAAKHWPGTDSRGLQCEPWGCVERGSLTATHLVAGRAGPRGPRLDADDALDALREACGAPTPSRRSTPSLREELTPKGGPFAREAPDAKKPVAKAAEPSAHPGMTRLAARLHVVRIVDELDRVALDDDDLRRSASPGTATSPLLRRPRRGGGRATTSRPWSRASTAAPPTSARRRQRAAAAAAESDAPVAVVLRVDAPPPAEDGEDKAVAKYRKLLKMGMPRDGIATKMAAEGLDPALLGLEPPAALARERSTRAYPKPVAAPRATEKLKALWWEPLDQAAPRSRSGAPGAADFEAARGALRAGCRTSRATSARRRARRETARRRRSARRPKNFAAPPASAQEQLSLRKIQDAGLGDAARVAAALRGERGADLGLDEDALSSCAASACRPRRPAAPARRSPRLAARRCATRTGEVRDLFDDGANLLGMLERRRVAIEGGDDDDFASDEGDDDWDD
ncbi:Nfx1-type zinc finger-containing protein [Aureococcus anophagefferens]|nr:Nfx1-type zinc finger-containing protein [Aureococcus anophagefferens]